jgi:hypothetical protein
MRNQAGRKHVTLWRPRHKPLTQDLKDFKSIVPALNPYKENTSRNHVFDISAYPRGRYGRLLMSAFTAPRFDDWPDKKNLNLKVIRRVLSPSVSDYSLCIADVSIYRNDGS